MSTLQSMTGEDHFLTIRDHATTVSRQDAKVSLPRLTEVPKYLRVVRTLVKPGPRQAYGQLLRELVAEDIQPGGAKSFRVLRTVAGGNTTEIATGMGMNSLSDLDDPPGIKAWGEASYSDWLRRAAIIESTTVERYRYRPDLSNW